MVLYQSLECEKIKAVMEREGKRRGSWALGCTLDMGTWGQTVSVLQT